MEEVPGRELGTPGGTGPGEVEGSLPNSIVKAEFPELLGRLVGSFPT